MLAALKRSWANGSALIAGGGLLATATGVSLFVAERDDETTMRREVRHEAPTLGGDYPHGSSASDGVPLSPSNDVTSAPVMYQATVSKALGDAFDGPVALRDLSVGQVVGVLEEGLGPQKRYHRARSFGADDKPLMEGWYPQEFLVRVELTK
jgi:hypothetical protein